MDVPCHVCASGAEGVKVLVYINKVTDLGGWVCS